MTGGPLAACFTLGLLLAWTPAVAYADAAPGHLNVGLFDMPPFYSKDNEGRPTGELIATLDQVMKALNLSWEPHFNTPPDTLKGLVNGDLDLLMVIHHPMLKSKAIYGQEPMARLELMAFHRPGKNPTASLEDLRGQRLALLRGYGYGGLVEQLMSPESGLELKVAEGHLEAFQWLNEDRVDFVLDYRRPAKQAIEALNLSDVEADLLQQIDVYFVVSAKLADGEQLLGRMDRTLKTLAQKNSP